MGGSFAGFFYFMARRLQSVLSDSGGMYVKLDGLDTSGAPASLCWQLLAGENHGPNIPCAPAIALTGKIAAGATLPAGAGPCLGVLTLDDILDALRGFRVREVAPPSRVR